MHSSYVCHLEGRTHRVLSRLLHPQPPRHSLSCQSTVLTSAAIGTMSTSYERVKGSQPCTNLWIRSRQSKNCQSGWGKRLRAEWVGKMLWAEWVGEEEDMAQSVGQLLRGNCCMLLPGTLVSVELPIPLI